MYEEGLARLATEPYRTPDSQNLRIRNMHLTNYAVNKTSDNFDNNCAGNAGSKRLLTAVLEVRKILGEGDGSWGVTGRHGAGAGRVLPSPAGPLLAGMGR